MSSLYLKSHDLPVIVKSAEYKRKMGCWGYCAECRTRILWNETIYETENEDWVCQPCAELREYE